ncbi:MAG: helix-turn-helix transcriptional regulator [Austwickia sp.]|jgi:PadR family transcriptional regulator, regulatory protein PadR|nr:MAG: helix-turn-helix transcriptional regulator [Austwickia sp.]
MARHDPQMLKGVLSLLLLRVLAGADGYGYSIVTLLNAAGFPDLVEGSVYPALTRLETAGHLESYLRRSDSGPARKYYRLTAAGHAELVRSEAAWAQFVTAVSAVHPEPGHPDPQEA